MKDIQQLIKKNSQEGRYEDIFPKTFIDAVEDRESGNSLTEILSGFNMYFLSYNGSREYTRLQVPMSIRKTGLWVTYVLYDKTVVTEWYAGEAIDDNSWGDSSNWRVGTNTLVGDISISSDGYWVINGVVTATKAQGEQGITPMLRVGNNNHLQVSYTNGSSWIDVSTNPVYTQFRVLNNKLQQSTDLGNTYTYISEELAYKFRESGNKLQMSKDLGNTWEDVSTNPVYTQFRINNNKLEQSVDLGQTWIVVSDELAYQFRNSGNKLQVSKDLGVTWEDTSDYIAAWFRWKTSTDNLGKVQISRDNKIWEDFSPDFINRMLIKGFVSVLPQDAEYGDIYMVGPSYTPGDTEHNNPYYRMWVMQDTWIDAGDYNKNTYNYNYNIKKTYESVSLMQSDISSPIGTDGTAIQIGDIVTVVNSTTPSENGFYSYEGAENGWKLQSGFNFQVESVRSQNNNTAPSSKLFDDLLYKISGNISALPYIRNDINCFPLIYKNKGYIRFSDGAISGLNTDPNFYHTDLLLLDKSKTTKVYLYASPTVAAVAFYDENKSYISGIESPKNGFVDYPTNAVYIRFSFCSETWNANEFAKQSIYSSFQVDLSTMTKFLQFDDEANKTYVDQLLLNYVPIKYGKNKYNPNDSNVKTGKFINTVNGVFSVNAGTLVTGFIPIEIGQTLITNAKSQFASNTLNLLYDENFVAIPESAINAYNGTIKYDETITYSSVPKYARLTLNSTIPNPQIEIGEMVTSYEPNNLIGGYVDYLPNKTYVDQLLSNYVKAYYVDNLLNKYDSDYKTGGHLQSNGNISNLAWAGLCVSNFISIKEGEILKANTYYDNIGMYICLYNENKTLVSSVSLQNQNYIIGTANAAYARFTLYGSTDYKYIIKKVLTTDEVVTYDKEGSPIAKYIENLATEDYVDQAIADNVNEKRDIVCDGDSLTWGDLGSSNANSQSIYNYPSILQSQLGDYNVVNYGVPGAPSPTLVGNASNYRARENFTIPATTTSVKFLCSMLRPIDNVDSWAFSPVQSHHSTIGGAKYMYIKGIKGSVSYTKESGDTEYKCVFTRLVAGDAVNVSNGDILLTEEYVNYANSDHLIFIGANGGWRLNGSTDNNNVDNINELIGQYRNIINSSKNELYIAMSYWAWVGSSGSGAWVGEDMFADAFGNHYLNLRAYFSTNSIQDAINRGYLPNDGTYPTTADTTAMYAGKIPPSLLVVDGVHLTDVGYHLLGDLVASKYKELIKMKILGAL